MRTSSAFATIVCPRCGLSREVTARQARRSKGTVCRRCSHEKPRKPPTDRERRFWLNRFTDYEIAELASGIWEVPVAPETIHIARERLALAASAARE